VQRLEHYRTEVARNSGKRWFLLNSLLTWAFHQSGIGGRPRTCGTVKQQHIHLHRGVPRGKGDTISRAGLICPSSIASIVQWQLRHLGSSDLAWVFDYELLAL